jgi:tRNA dimethylallyltransferase
MYGKEALETIHELFKTYRQVILCGGSGLYVKAVCEGFDDIPEVPEEVRASLMKGFEEHGVVWLQDQMRILDPELIGSLDVNNPHRMIRALEVRLSTGRSIAEFRKKAEHDHSFNIVRIGLELPREELYERIDRRMDMMIADGLFEEAKALCPYREKNALQTVGYREVFDHIDGLYDHEEAVRLMKRNSRRYAKRQMTWFKRDPDTKWFHPEQITEMLTLINQFK